MNLSQIVKQVSALDAVALAATTNGIVIDTQGFEQLGFAINVGDFATFDGTNKLTWKVQEGEQSDGSDMADIAAADYLASRNEAGAAWDRIMDGATDDEQAYWIGVALNQKRYRRLVVTEGGIVSVPCSATALLAKPRHAPVATTQAP